METLCIDKLDHQENPDHQGNPDHLDHMDHLDQLGHLDHLDHPDQLNHSTLASLNDEKIYHEDKCRICIVYLVLFKWMYKASNLTWKRLEKKLKLKLPQKWFNLVTSV